MWHHRSNLRYSSCVTKLFQFLKTISQQWLIWTLHKGVKHPKKDSQKFDDAVTFCVFVLLFYIDTAAPPHPSPLPYNCLDYTVPTGGITGALQSWVICLSSSRGRGCIHEALSKRHYSNLSVSPKSINQSWGDLALSKELPPSAPPPPPPSRTASVHLT